MKTVLVTGSSGLIGRRLSEILSEKYNVVGIDIVDSDYTCDLTCEMDVVRLFKTLKVNSRNAPMDVFALVNCVGIPDYPTDIRGGGISELSYELFRKHIDVNLCSVFLTMREFAANFSETGKHIINISSMYSMSIPKTEMYEGKIKNPGYVASKFGLVGMSQYFAVLTGGMGIRVNCVGPGCVDGSGVDSAFLARYKDKVPLGCTIDMEEVGRSVRHILETEKMTGQNVIIDGGFTLV